jgi:ABC-2 type transport system permease protein
MTFLTTSSKRFNSRFVAELHVLWAVLKKQWFHVIRYPSWVIQLIIWPLIFPAAYILTARAFAGPDQMALQYFTEATGTNNYIGFIIVGTVVWMWQNIVLWDVGLALRNEQLRGTLESNWLSPAWRFSLLIGASLVQMITVVLFVIVTFLEYRLIFKVPFNANIGLTILVFLASVPAIYGIGITFASLVIRLKEANAFVYLVRGMVMIFCGVSFPIAVLPGWMVAVSKWLPQTYMIRAIRMSTLTNAGFQDLQKDILILLAFGVFWLTTGYITFNWMERLSRKSGIIGQY